MDVFFIAVFSFDNFFGGPYFLERRPSFDAFLPHIPPHFTGLLFTKDESLHGSVSRQPLHARGVFLLFFFSTHQVP